MSRLHGFFDKVVAINLGRRWDRWSRLQRHIDALDWPFLTPERFEAVDGRATTHPHWWRQGDGAWGCLMSHARILEDCLQADVKSVLILEDDVVFTGDLRQRSEEFLSAVPDDWDQIYLGGQHLIDPVPVNDQVYRGRNVNRTHAYAVSRKFMARMYRHILHAPDYILHGGHHVDHRLGALHEAGDHAIYSPRQWLAGQFQGSSDISGQTNDTFFWNTWATVRDMPLVVVLGLHSGRSNEIAAELASLGVHFGHHLAGIAAPRMEDVGLAKICEEMFPFPETWRQRAIEEVRGRLTPWITLIQREAANYGVVAGACYPQVCALHTEFSRAWSNLKVIDVRGDEAGALQRLLSRGGVEPRDARRAQDFLIREREQWAREDRLIVDVAELDRDRGALRQTLRDFVGVARRPELEQTA